MRACLCVSVWGSVVVMMKMVIMMSWWRSFILGFLLKELFIHTVMLPLLAPPKCLWGSLYHTETSLIIKGGYHTERTTTSSESFQWLLLLRWNNLTKMIQNFVQSEYSESWKLLNPTEFTHPPQKGVWVGWISALTGKILVDRAWCVLDSVICTSAHLLALCKKLMRCNSHPRHIYLRLCDVRTFWHTMWSPYDLSSKEKNPTHYIGCCGAEARGVRSKVCAPWRLLGFTHWSWGLT